MAFTDRLHNRGSISTGYDIDNSLKLEDDNSEGLIKNYSGDGDRRTWTYSTWIKRTELSQDYYCLFFAAYTGIQFMSEDWLRVELYDGTTTRYADTNQLFRDTSAWYHLVVTLDSTDSTASDRVKIWINGNRVTSFRTSTYANMAQNDQFGIGQASDNYQFGYWFAGGANDRRFCGYVAETHYVNGTALEASDFGEFDDNNIWIPKEYTGSHGSKGFYLKFDDSSNLGKDSSSGGIGDFTLSNITSADQATDTPTNNFCTWNPLWAFPKVAGIEEGGTKTNGDFNASTWRGAKGSMGVSRGKWYWENKASGNDTIHGWQTDNCVPDSGSNSHNVISTIAFYEAGNYIWLKDSTSGRNDSSVTGTYAGGQVIGFALNLDSSPQTASFYRNGSAIATNVNIDGLANQTLFPITSHYNQTSQANFGGYTSMSNAHTNTDENGYGSFVYAPPSGYYALCTKNLAEYG